MDSVIRAIAVYAVLLLIFRIAGKRSLAQISTFDFVLLLIISEAIQQALLGNDSSMTNALLVVVTLVGLDIGLSLIKQRSQQLEKVVDGMPVVLLADGKPIKERMDKERVDESDILVAARSIQGLERLDQIKYAVLEQSGGISIIPKEAKR
ncbi:MAG: DUF421 domain-containing protein [Chloroflexi bacterium]|nr:DUF421 domain-containing protein [Chloroflexota bacterium]